MKKIIGLIILLSFPLMCFAEDAADNTEIKTAIIHYKNGESSLIVYIDGNKKAAESFNKKGEKTRLEFFDGENSYQVSLIDNGAVKLDNPRALLTVYYFLDEPGKEKLSRKAFVLGKECNVYQMRSGTYYFWRGIMLKREFNMSFSLITEAINIEINVPIPKDKFIVPSNIKSASLSELRDAQSKRIFGELSQNKN